MQVAKYVDKTYSKHEHILLSSHFVHNTMDFLPIQWLSSCSWTETLYKPDVGSAKW